MGDYLLWHGVFAAAGKYPDRPAVQDGTRTLSYRELARDAGLVAAALADRDIGRGDRVGLLGPKSTRMVATMVGISRAGAAYVPVDPAQPAARARTILADASVRALVTTRKWLRQLEPLSETLPSVCTVLLIDDDADRAAGDGSSVTWTAVASGTQDPPDIANVEDDPAYILYTSGSTGRPKGVTISHRNALTFVTWGLRTFEIGVEDVLSNHAPFHFDLSVFDLYCALHAAARVALVPDRVAPFPAELARWIEDTGITVWYSVPSALVRLLAHGDLQRFDYLRLRAVLFAGEVFPVAHLRHAMEAFPHAKFANLYGPTETNVCTWYAVPRPLPADVTALPIGQACENIECFALTDEGAAARPGQNGELLVRGPCVMLGYWGLPERTAQSVMQNPLHTDYSDPVYRTGDIVRVRDDGGFDFVGRRDHMVKTRGYRVELGEIEHVLQKCPGVFHAVVVAVPDIEIGARLQAGVVLEPDADTDVSRISSHCGQHLPRYAVPDEIRVLAAIPMTSTGKVDRSALASLISPPTSTVPREPE